MKTVESMNKDSDRRKRKSVREDNNFGKTVANQKMAELRLLQYPRTRIAIRVTEKTKMAAFWYVAAFIIMMISLMVQAVHTSETSVRFYQTTRCNNPEDSHIHIHRRENLKLHLKAEVRNSEYLNFPSNFSLIFDILLDMNYVSLIHQ
jgi:hypothetical protein